LQLTFLLYVFEGVNRGYSALPNFLGNFGSYGVADDQEKRPQQGENYQQRGNNKLCA
jgi:hypothetical protein